MTRQIFYAFLFQMVQRLDIAVSALASHQPPFLLKALRTVDIRDLAVRLNVLQGAYMVFVNDFSNTHDDGPFLAIIRLLFIAFVSMIGFLLHPDKQPFPSQCLKVLGYEIDAEKLTLSIAGDKQAKWLILVSDTLKDL